MYLLPEHLIAPHYADANTERRSGGWGTTMVKARITLAENLQNNNKCCFLHFLKLNGTDQFYTLMRLPRPHATSLYPWLVINQLDICKIWSLGKEETETTIGVIDACKIGCLGKDQTETTMGIGADKLYNHCYPHIWACERLRTLIIPVGQLYQAHIPQNFLILRCLTLHLGPLWCPEWAADSGRGRLCRPMGKGHHPRLKLHSVKHTRNLDFGSFSRQNSRFREKCL